MKSNISLLQPDSYYHIYNRGINGCSIFSRSEHYNYFLKRYAQYINPIAKTYAYCLLGNHFHFLLATRTETELNAVCNRTIVQQTDEPRSLSHHISLQFAHLFNAYSQAYNKAMQRTGSLFEKPFRRKHIANDKYLMQVLYYIHANPQKHGLIDDFANYPHSSYKSFLTLSPTQLQRQAVWDWFDGQENFILYHTHQPTYNDKWISENWIEIDE